LGHFAGIQQVYLGGGAPFARLIQEPAGGQQRDTDGGGVNPWGDSLPILRSLILEKEKRGFKFLCKENCFMNKNII
jgi:hypothetical protein